MKAMILAAGLGTRLMPLTASTPKALVPVNGIPLLELAIRRLMQEGFDELIVNVHHFALKVINYLAEQEFGDSIICISDESGSLLDTGGGMQNASWFLEGDEPFLVWNVDVVSDIDLRKMMDAHTASGALATLAVRQRTSGRYLLFDEESRLRGWEDAGTGELHWAGPPCPQALRKAFSGIHIISPGIFSLITETGKFSIIDTYLRLGGTHLIRGYDHTEGSSWFDAGKPEQLQPITDYLTRNPEYLSP